MRAREFYILANKQDIHCEPMQVSTSQISPVGEDDEIIHVMEVLPGTMTISRDEMQIIFSKLEIVRLQTDEALADLMERLLKVRE